MKGNQVTISLGRSVTSFAVSLVLAGCGGATTSITGSTTAPSPAVSVDRQAAGLTCDENGIGDCAVGDTGPAGGVVFYDAGSEKDWGRYLEAAPARWNMGGADQTAMWCDNTDLGIDRAVGVGIGSGMANTQAIVAECSSGAAWAAAGYNGGGMDDWFLPSSDELNQLYKQREIVGGFGSGTYWSSSQNNDSSAWFQVFPSGSQDYRGYKYNVLGIRPVRAF